MQRFFNNLTAVAVMGLILMSGSLAFAHGGGGGHGGGGHGGGRSGAGRSGGGRSMSHVSQHRGSQHRGSSHKGNMGKPKGNHKSVSNKNKNKNKNDHKRDRHKHRRPHYHMHYPVRGWFDGDDIEDGDSDAVEGGLDVEFTSIRQLDAGDPSKNLVPAYRVWFHNNSTVDIDQPFDVAILGSTDQQLTDKLPYASMRVEGMAADETTSVDIRLPIEAMSMGSDAAAATPYSFLHTIIDAQRELVETNKANNLSVYAREDIPALEE